MTYQHLCRSLDYRDPILERVDYPRQDLIQDAWLAGLTALRRQGKPLPNAQTTHEIHEAFEADAGLFVTCLNTATSDYFRATRGNSVRTPRRRELLERVFSLDGIDGVAYAELIEDIRLSLPLRFIEDYDLVFNDPRLRTLPIEHKAAIKRFALAWVLQDAGYSLPPVVRNRIARDRRRTGLPLVLRRGNTRRR